MPDQKPTINKASTANKTATYKNALNKNVKAGAANISRDFKAEFASFAGEVKKFVLDFGQKWEKFRDIVKNNYELGRMHLGLGNLKDALIRFKFVLWLEPGHVDAMYYLGATYMAMGNKKAAAEWFVKVLKVRPNFEEAKYLLSIASKRATSGQDMPKKMPLSLAVEYFDGLAATYNSEQVELLKYEGHIQLDNALRSCLTPGRMDHIILELGVGTGLCGPGVRDVAAHLTGVDLSANMLAEAVKVLDRNGKKIYDALIKRETLEFLADNPESGYDIVMSAGMVSYMGDLDALFAQSKRVLKDKGLFAFTAEVLEGNEYRFEPSDARFHYSKAYLQELAKRYGFEELRLKDLAIYAEYPAWVCVFRK